MNEEKLLRKLRQGDAAALSALMDRYLPYVSAVVWSILRGALPPEDAEETVSDVFLAAWSRAETLRPGHVKAWLGSVARNQARTRLRRAGHELPLDEELLDFPAPDDPADEAMRQEERRAVRKAIDAMSETDRAIFLRRYYYLQSVEEIARALSLNVSTVKTHLFRGRARLKETLMKEGFYESQHL